MRPKGKGGKGGKPRSEAAGAITDSAWCVDGGDGAVPQVRDLHAAGETLAAFERSDAGGIVLDSGCSGTAVRSQEQQIRSSGQYRLNKQFRDTK